ncbi:reverse transcriptase [Gossypium australe]|uniref:Reverse transcriptase n=1 Tax=Gossypium australe TaxID=47621 RepID=A0A5B6UVQ5_9ROSI|nr:reverse transcriptase [Gossypium australe]
MLAGRTLCQPKGMGGIGLRNMKLFNIALLGCQVWRLISNKNSLCFKVLSSKYFPDGNIFNAKKVNRASYTWSSIATVADLLKNGFRWQVGNGETINIKKDNWGLEGLNGNTIIPNMLLSCDGSKESERCWNVEKVQRLYGKDWGDSICDILIESADQSDRMIWFHNLHGVFTSKSAYSWLLLKELGYGPHRCFWKNIWKLKMLQKIRVFAWRVGHEILPTKVKIASISSDVNVNCPRCGTEAETVIHALRD